MINTEHENKQETPESLKIEICGADGLCKASFTGDREVFFDWRSPYEKGDFIRITSEEKPLLAEMRLDQALTPCRIFSPEGELVFPVPFDEAAKPYGADLWQAGRHWGFVKKTEESELKNTINLACSSADHEGNHTFYPHASSNVKMSNPQFLARNAIDGICAPMRHGSFPYSSWSLDQKPEAELTIDFGRPVLLDEIRVYCRADYPHDGWLESCKVTPGNNNNNDNYESLHMPLKKGGERQSLFLNGLKTSKITLSDFVMNTTQAPFTAITQVECIGKEDASKEDE